jgi:hypothetical protein
MSFNTNINKLAHKIKADHNISWGAALKMAYAYDKAALPVAAAAAPSSVFGAWSAPALRAVAGHFWGLAKAAQETGDTGRSIAFFKVSKSLYAHYESASVPMTFRSFIRAKGVSYSVAKETVDFFIASGRGELTTRSQDLITTGATNYAARIKAPVWTF